MTRRPAAVAGVALLALALAGCGGGATGEDLAASEEAVRAAAREDIPVVAEALGGEVQEAWGEVEFGGDGIVDRRRYEVTATVRAAGVDADAVAAAFEEAGYEVVQNSPAGIVGEREALSVGTAPPQDGTLRVNLRGAWLELDDGVPRDASREPVDLG